jgi:peptidoglycan hydrolase-like protein with peptidoglycan-binding domain
MIKSDLATEIYEASENNYTKGRNGYSICKITPHHMAGVLTGTECARIFQNSGRGASANYCIGYDGDIVCSVDEENRAWTSASRSNDSQAITIEVSDSEYGEPWPISDASWNSLVNLCVDICRRYGFRLNYTWDPSGSLTRHNMFANTNCPGQTLQDRFPELEATVNAILDGDQPGPTPPTPPTPPAPQNERVATVQRWLNEYGYSTAVDGIAGPKTCANVVKVYQNELNKQFGAGLKVDGVYGPATYDASWHIISQGAKGNITKSIQAALICKNYEVALDGDYGPDTTYTVAGFQGDNGLPSTGAMDQDTSSKLYT